MDLSRVDWDAALPALTVELGGGDAAARRKLAALSSLRARFTDDPGVAAAAVATAIALEPLEPLHRVRGVLARLRFGDVAGALGDVEALPEAVADLPRVLVLKAFATLRRGQPAMARNIADRAVQIDPRFAPARFVLAEATLRAQRKSGLDKLLELPCSPELAEAWTDLLAKLAVLRPCDHRAIAAQLERGAIARGSRGDALVRSAMQWASPATTPDDLARIAGSQPTGSRGEQLALTLLAIRLAAGDLQVACTALYALAMRHRDRPAMRRTLVAALTRLAVAEASAERLSSALRVVQACIELEPFEPAHQHNRAVVFTLLGEQDAALDAWAELDRLHYRLALLGCLDADDAARYAAPHRMFALAARLPSGGSRAGVFAVEHGDSGKRSLEVNDDAIARDPEQLRQWLHHSRAALTFEMVGLGTARDRLLLGPSDPVDAAARVDGLCLLARSLGVLVSNEGRQLADRLAAQFRATGQSAPQRYVPIALDPAAMAVQRHAIELYAELALICFRWSPEPAQRGLVDEVVETLRAVAPLFDDRVLTRLVKDGEPGATSALGFLRDAIPDLLHLAREDRERPLDRAERVRLTQIIATELRVTSVEHRIKNAADDYELLASELDAARQDDPASAHLEWVAANVLALGSFFDDATHAIAACRKLAKDEPRWLEKLDKLEQQVAEARKDGRTRARAQKPPPPRPVERARDFAAQEIELAEQPTAIALYIELCHELACAGQWLNAHAWAERAISRCLTSASQLRARALALELLGLEAIAAQDASAVVSYLAGARASALSALETMPAGEVGLEYVRGICLLAADRRHEARAAFRAARDRCARGIYLAVLRPLAADVEHALLETARAEIDAACRDRRYPDAYTRIAERMATVAAPAPYLFELARVQFAALLPTIGTADPPPAPPEIRVATAWGAELAAAAALPDAIARTRALLELAVRCHEPCARDAEGVIRRLDELAGQLTVVARLEQITVQAATGDLAGALAALDEFEPGHPRNPRILRQRALTQLQLARYGEADAAADALAEFADPVARDFTSRYPRLRLQHRIAAASALVRRRDFVGARAALDGLTADPEHEIELAYVRACCAAAEGYHRRDVGDRTGARELLFEGLRWVEAVIERAREAARQRLLALHHTLESDVAALEDDVA